MVSLSQKRWNDSPSLYRSFFEVHESAYRVRRAAFAGVSQLVLLQRWWVNVSRNNSPSRRVFNVFTLLAIMSAGGLVAVRSIVCCLLFVFFFGRPLFFFFLGRPRFCALAKYFLNDALLEAPYRSFLREGIFVFFFGSGLKSEARVPYPLGVYYNSGSWHLVGGENFHLDIKNKKNGSLWCVHATMRQFFRRAACRSSQTMRANETARLPRLQGKFKHTCSALLDVTFF